MGRKRKEKPKQRELINKEPPDQRILDSIGNPNVWTPKTEEAWLKEVKKLKANEIYQRFPPINKPTHVGRRGKNRGWSNF